MNWFGYVLIVLQLVSLAAIPATAVYGWIWWRGSEVRLPGWRVLISRMGIVWCSLNLLLVVVFLVSTRVHPLPFNDFRPSQLWASLGFLVAVPGLVFALLGKGRVRIAFLLNALSAFWFWISLLSTL